jgi:hypothetical protein
MLVLNTRNNELRKEYNKLKILTGDAYQELNPYNLVKKLMLVTRNPEVLWDLFNNEKHGFFSECIIRDYHIKDNFAENVVNDYRWELRSLMRKHEIGAREVGQNLQKKIDLISKEN